MAETTDASSGAGGPLRVLIVIDNFHPLIGGAELAALESGRALARRGHRVDVLTMRKRPDWPVQEEIAGLRVLRFRERVPARPLGRFLYERANANAARRFIDRELRDTPYDLMLLHPIAAAFGAIQSRAAERAVVIYCFHAPLCEEHLSTVQGLVAPDARRLRRWAISLSAACTAHRRGKEQAAALARADAVTCPSKYSLGLLSDAFPGLGAKPIKVIPWGVDAERFRPAASRQALRARLGWAPGERVLLTVRRLVPRMGIGELIRGFGLAASQRQGLRLVVGGEGPLRPQLVELARSAGGRVEFTGLIPPDDLPAYLQAADLFVLPSLTLEAFGLVTLEALACGTPVLATKRCAAPEILESLDERLLMPGTDAQAMADALLRAGIEVAEDHGLRQRCRDYVAQRYSWDRTAAAFEALALRLQAAKPE